MTAEQGDGTMAKRIAPGLSPKCETALPKDPRSECRVCGLKVQSGKAQDDIDTESVISMTGALR